MRIPFNKPYMTGHELEYIGQAHARGHLSGDGDFTRRCSEWIASRHESQRVLLTHSCTAALEMAAILADIAPGDEIIMPSFTFVSTANAFVLRGGVPVFVDVRPDTLNIDEELIEAAITDRTRAIMVVHYAGVGCEMDRIQQIAEQHGLLLIEDAAQAILASYKGRPLGSFGQMAALSFHETKNVISGEGGALLVNDARFIERAVVIREKGTNRSRFLLGQVDKYSWVDIGSSYLPSELIAAFLWAQLEAADSLLHQRLAIWNTYREAFSDLERLGRIRIPAIPPEAQHNGHLFYLMLRDAADRQAFLSQMAADGIYCVIHYVPLHTSDAGRRFGRASGDLRHTDEAGNCLVRIPLWFGVEEHQPYIIEKIRHYLQGS